MGQMTEVKPDELTMNIIKAVVTSLTAIEVALIIKCYLDKLTLHKYNDDLVNQDSKKNSGLITS